MLYSILRILVLISFKILFRLEIKGGKNIPTTGSLILASNHASYLDPIVLAVACPRRLSFMARHELFSIPVFGTFIRKMGAFPLKRNYADISSIKEALRHLEQKGALVLFPEGTRAFGGSAERGQPGVGFIAAKSGAPVVPVFINGTSRALGRNARFIRPAKIKVYFGGPIYADRPLSSSEKIKDSSNGIYSDNSSLKQNYEEFAMKIMQEIKRTGQEKGENK